MDIVPSRFPCLSIKHLSNNYMWSVWNGLLYKIHVGPNDHYLIINISQTLKTKCAHKLERLQKTHWEYSCMHHYFRFTLCSIVIFKKPVSIILSRSRHVFENDNISSFFIYLSSPYFKLSIIIWIVYSVWNILFLNNSYHKNKSEIIKFENQY